ncbi:MAG TPA: ATP-binding protein [Ktedonosporobacter sp.]|nr:ATP-binding protein [Ktedonosporobacter sp.]
MQHLRNLIRTFGVRESTQTRGLKPAITIERCPYCLGAGFTRSDVQPGHPDFGKPVKCVCKIAEQREKRKHELVERSGVLSLHRFKNASFESFRTNEPDVSVAYKQARQFAACPLGWLIMTGPTGCGKTHLAVAIAKARLVAGDTVLMQTAPDLLDHLRSAYKSDVGFDETFRQLQEIDLLVLDDYGAELDTGWAMEKLYQLLNHRYNANAPTVVTSNCIDLVGIDYRVASRLRDRDIATLVQMREARDCRPDVRQVEGD